MVNSLMLLTHSVAAMQGHQGPARNDHRARLIAKALVVLAGVHHHSRPPPGRLAGRTRPAGRTRWTQRRRPAPGVRRRGRRRARLRLAGPRAARPAAVDRPTRSPRRSIAPRAATFWRWPTIRLQPDQLVRADVRRRRDGDRRDRPRAQRHAQPDHALRRAACAATAAHAGNLGPGMRFHYLPELAASTTRMNVDSAEYANIVLSFSRFYEQARHQGMKALPNSHVALLRQWTERVIAGYWTHGGYMNWDTGFGFERWHQAKKLGLTPAGADRHRPAPRLAAVGASTGGWAKWMLDRSLTWYATQAVRAGGLPDPVFFKLYSVPQTTAAPAWPPPACRPTRPARSTPASAACAAARAARAVRVRPRHRPPGGDDARRYNTAIVAGQPARVPVRRDRARAPVRR